jgi:hypothetical protein
MVPGRLSAGGDENIRIVLCLLLWSFSSGGRGGGQKVKWLLHFQEVALLWIVITSYRVANACSSLTPDRGEHMNIPTTAGQPVEFCLLDGSAIILSPAANPKIVVIL